MPKINATHRVERIRKRIAQLECSDALEARDINALLTPLQQKQLKTAWAKQQHLRKLHKPPKTNEEKHQLGWKTIREVRLEVFKQALDDILNNLVAEMEKIQHKSEVRAGRVFMDAFSDAHKNGKNTWSEGNNALTRAHFKRIDGKKSTYRTVRDKQVNEIEDSLRKSLEKDLTEDDKEQLELSKQHDKSKRKLK
jgi:hypothetical protein